MHASDIALMVNLAAPAYMLFEAQADARTLPCHGSSLAGSIGPSAALLFVSLLPTVVTTDGAGSAPMTAV